MGPSDPALGHLGLVGRLRLGGATDRRCSVAVDPPADVADGVRRHLEPGASHPLFDQSGGLLVRRGQVEPRPGVLRVREVPQLGQSGVGLVGDQGLDVEGGQDRVGRGRRGGDSGLGLGALGALRSGRVGKVGRSRQHQRRRGAEQQAQEGGFEHGARRHLVRVFFFERRGRCRGKEQEKRHLRSNCSFLSLSFFRVESFFDCDFCTRVSEH